MKVEAFLDRNNPELYNLKLLLGVVNQLIQVKQLDSHTLLVVSETSSSIGPILDTERMETGKSTNGLISRLL